MGARAFLEFAKRLDKAMFMSYLGFFIDYYCSVITNEDPVKMAKELAEVVEEVNADCGRYEEI